MEQRLDYGKAAPHGIAALRALQAYVDRSGLDQSLLDLIRTRASQLNGCAYCLDMHTKDARVAGESEQRLYVLSAWREAPTASGSVRRLLRPKRSREFPTAQSTTRCTGGRISISTTRRLSI